MLTKLKLLTLFYILASFSVIQCTYHEKTENEYISTDQSKQYQIHLEKMSEFSIQPPEGLRLDAVRNLVSFHPKDHKILWVNTLQKQLFVTDFEGQVISFFGQQGAGSGEFRDITAAGFNEKGDVVVYDWQLDRINIFDVEGNLLSELPGLLESGLWIRSKRITSHSEHLYFGVQESVGRSEVWNTSVIAQVSLSGELRSIFGGYGKDLQQRGLFYNHPYYEVNQNLGEVFITHNSYHITEVVSLESGETITRFGVQPENFRYSEDQVVETDTREERDRKNLKQSSTVDPFFSDRYFFFHYYNFTEEFFEKIDRNNRLFNPNHLDNYFAVYDHTHPYSYYGEIALPYAPLGVTTSGNVFLLENDNPDSFTVGVYRLNVGES